MKFINVIDDLNIKVKCILLDSVNNNKRRRRRKIYLQNVELSNYINFKKVTICECCKYIYKLLCVVMKKIMMLLFSSLSTTNTASTYQHHEKCNTLKRRWQFTFLHRQRVSLCLCTKRTNEYLHLNVQTAATEQLASDGASSMHDMCWIEIHVNTCTHTRVYVGER